MRKIFRFNWWIEQAQLQSIVSGILVYELFMAFGYILPNIKSQKYLPEGSDARKDNPNVDTPDNVIGRELEFFNIYVQTFLVFI